MFDQSAKLFCLFNVSQSLSLWMYKHRPTNAPCQYVEAYVESPCCLGEFDFTYAMWSLSDDFYFIYKVICPAIVSAPAYGRALITCNASHSWHVLKSVHSSCHNKQWRCTGYCWQGPIINIVKQTARQGPQALTAPSYKRKWKRRWIEISDSSNGKEGIG